MTLTDAKGISENMSFLVNWSEVSGKRWDPSYWTSEKASFFNIINTIKDKKQLKRVIEECSYGVLPPGETYDEKNPISLVRATDLSNDLIIDLSDNKKVKQEYFDNHPRARLRKNDVLIAVKGATIASSKSIGFVITDTYNTIINGSIFRFQCTNEVLPKYIAYCLDLEITKKQMRHNLVKNNAVDYLDKSTLERIIISIPSKNIQEKVISIMDDAYYKKHSKESKAAELQSSIDGYLLQELNINLPKEIDNSIGKRMFMRQWSEISGNRWDPFYYQDYYYTTETMFINHPQHKRLGQLINSICNGFDSRSFVPEGVIYLKVANIKPYELELTESQYIKCDDFIPSRAMLHKGDILLTRKGTYGVAKLIEEDVDYIPCSEIFIVRTENYSDARYLEVYFNTVLSKIQFEQHKIGAIMGSLTQDVIKRLYIIYPDAEVRNAIIKEVHLIRNNMKGLQREAQQVVLDAKEMVENMLMCDNWSNLSRC